MSAQGRRPRRARRRGISAAFLAVGLGVPGAAAPAPAMDFTGRLALEMEYLGQSYFSQQVYSDEDLGLPPGSSLLTPDTTRFHDDSWLPGPSLELGWGGRDARGRTVAIRAATSVNAETFSQDASVRAELPAGAGAWRLRAEGSFLDDARSLVGRGDWRAGAEVERTRPLGSGREGALRLGWEHSRGRADSVSYLYDYELVRIRASARAGDLLGGGWEGHVEGAGKFVPGGASGSWREVRMGGERRGGIGDDRLTVELRVRDVDGDGGTGRDFRSAEAGGERRLAGSDSLGVGIEADLQVTDYRGRDDLYFDAAGLDLYLPVRRGRGGWTMAAGPAAEAVRDLGGGSRDYLQWSARTSAERFLTGGGFVELDLEGGRRDYRGAGAATIEISSLSSSLTRSDYWLLDLFAVASLPISPGVSVDLMASSAWEFHRDRSERIQVTFVTLSAARRF